jgi:hypothetical protein
LFFYLGLWINLFHIKKHQKIEKEQTTQRPKEKRINVQTTIYKATHKTKDLVTRIPRLPVDFSLRVFWRKRTVYLKIFWSFSIKTEKKNYITWFNLSIMFQANRNLWYLNQMRITSGWSFLHFLVLRFSNVGILNNSLMGNNCLMASIYFCFNLI